MGSFKADTLRYLKLTLFIKNLTARHIRRQPTLPTQLEEGLAKYCTVMKEKFYGLTIRGIRVMAYKLTSTNGITQKISKNN